MKMPYHDCPRFNVCSVNICPVDPDIKQKNFEPGDEVCTLPKSYRMRLGKDLPWLGLRPRELTSKRRWEALPEAEKEQIKARGKALSERMAAKKAESALKGDFYFQKEKGR